MANRPLESCKVCEAYHAIAEQADSAAVFMYIIERCFVDSLCNVFVLCHRFQTNPYAAYAFLTFCQAAGRESEHVEVPDVDRAANLWPSIKKLYRSCELVA